MGIPFVMSWNDNAKNHGPVCFFECPQCHKKACFYLVSEKVVFRIWFIPVGESDGSWSLRCGECGGDIVLNDADTRQAVDMSEYIKPLSLDELKETNLEGLLEEYPIEAIRGALKLNTTWPCPKCGAAVPETLTACWQCQYYFSK